MYSNKYLKICLIFIFLQAYSIEAQKYNIKLISGEEGLVQTQINSIVQDKNGVMYLCAEGSSVITYNGKSFSNFPFPNETIRSNDIFKLFKDSKNNIWFCSSRGLIKFDGKRNEFFTDRDGLTDNDISVIIEDKKGTYWIGSKKGLTKYDGTFTKIKGINKKRIVDNVRTIQEDDAGNIWIANGSIIQKISDKSIDTYTIPIPSPRNVIKQLFYDSEKRLWLATVSGLYYFENNSFKKFARNNILYNNQILKIFESKDGNLWFAVRDHGIVRYDRKNFIAYNVKNGLVSDLVFEIFQDKEDNIWFGTNEGLELFIDEAFVKYDRANGLPENMVWSIFEDNKNEIAVSTDKYGFSILSNGNFKILGKQKFPDDNQYYDIYQDVRGIFWLAARTGLYTYNGNDIKKVTGQLLMQKSGVSAIYGDKENNLWFCTFDAGIFKYDGNTFKRFYDKNGLLPGEVFYVFDDGNGNIWISTVGGISIFDGKKFTNFSSADSPFKKEIYSIKKDKWGGLWCASFGGGLYRVTGNDKQHLNVRNITVKDGLISDNIYLIETDDYGRLWIGTQAGLCFLSLNDYYEKNQINIKKYNREDGIPHAEYNQAASLKDSKGILWFGTNKGLIRCDPSKIKTNNVEPTTIINNIKINFREEDLSQYGDVVENRFLPRNLKLPYNMNHVTIDFIGISLGNPSKVQYKYMLENFDKEWHQTTEKNSETYSNLPSGSYTFKVLSCNNDGVWNKLPVCYSFTVLSPYYRKWWFISLAIILFISFTIIYYKYRIRRIQQLNKKLKKTLNERIITEKKLLQSENEYRGLFENSHDAILIIDPYEHSIIIGNKAACTMYGYSENELAGLNYSNITTDFERAKKNFIKTLENKKWCEYETRHISKTGELFDIDACVAAINYKGNIAIVALLHNITKHKIIESALIEAKEQAEKSNQLKSNFLAQMSHEIRTPVNTILSWISLLKSEIKDLVSGELNESFTFIENGGRRLIRTIDSILNMSELQSGSQEVFPEKIELYKDVLLDLYNELKQNANARSLEFTIINNAVNDLVMGDHYSLSQLFVNLIDNAIKYTKKGSISIILEDSKDKTVTVYIKDTGIGISEEYLPNLFIPFSQEETGYTRNFEGNGLGLALVKSYCDLNSGQIEVESKKGVGTTFKVTFKLI